MLSNKEGEIWHNAFYNDISSNNIENLDKLINEWPHNLEELDELLSKAYGELKLKNVWLKNETQIFIENKLINLRFFSDTSRHDQIIRDVDGQLIIAKALQLIDQHLKTTLEFSKLLNNTRERIELTLQSIRLLQTDYSNTEKVDGKFIFLAKFIAKNIHVLKQQLNSTHDRLPWEQMEFCLVIFIASYTKKQEMNLYYRATLNKRRILLHIENFAVELEAQKGKLLSSKHEPEFKKIINGYPGFEELYKENQQIREVQSLVKISDHIKSKVLKSNPAKTNGQLIIAKALNLIGEYLESTWEFSKLFFNTTTSEQKNTSKIIVELRNSLSLLATAPPERIGTEENRDLNVLEDVKKVGDVITGILNELNTNATEIFVKNKLISLRSFFVTDGKDPSLKVDDDKNTLIQLILQNISLLRGKYSNMEEVDENFIFTTKSIEQNISKIKRKLKLTNDRLPWEEMEFCLGSFVNSYTKKQEMNPFYRGLLNKFRILNHLENFAKKLEDENTENEQVITNNNIPGFEYLYKDFQQIRDVHSLRKISDHIKLALSTNLNEKGGLLIITRVLQVIGEHLKNTQGSPKLSNTISEHLLLSLQKKARSILKELRDLLSHDDNDSLSKRIEIEKKLDDNYFFNLKNDMKKVGNAITNILYNNEIEIIRIILMQIKACKKSNDLNEIAELFTTVQFNEIVVLKNFKIIEHEKLEKLLKELNERISEQTDSEKNMFNEIDDELKCERNRSENLRSGYDNRVDKLRKVIESLSLIKHDTDDHIELIKNVAKEALLNITSDIESKKNFHRWKKISDLSKTIFVTAWRRNHCYLENLSGLMWDILYIAEFGTGDIKWIEKFRETLNEKCSFTSAKQEKNNQKKTYKETKEKYENQLGVKLSELKRILSENSLSSSTLEKLFFYKSDKKTQAVVEMHLLDIMAILDNSKNYLENNLLFLDDNAPLVNGKCLRNHLAHDNALFDILLSDPSIAVILNAIKLTEENLPRSKKKIGKLVIDDPIKLREKYNRDLFIITNQERMFVAVEEGNMETLKDCIENGADVRARSINSWNTLHFAAKGPSLEVVEFITSLLLLNSRCTSIPDDFNGQSPLHIAAAYGRTSIVECFINKYFFEVDNLNKRFETPLHLAAQNGHKDTVELLLKNKANTISQEESGLTPVEYAIFYNHTDAAKSLLETDKDVNNKSIYNCTPLHNAAYSGNLELVNFLLESNVHVNARAQEGSTPLHLAALRGHMEVVNTLIVKGAVVNATNKNNYTPLQFAIDGRHEEIVNILLKHTDNVNAINTIYGMSYLNCAAVFGHLGIVKTLLKNDADVNLPNIEGKTPLHCAAYFGHFEICKVFLQHDATIDARDISNYTPLYCAAHEGHIKVVELLINNGADLNAKTSDGKTPLYIAALQDHKDVIDLLLRKKADVNAKDTYGGTTLHAVARNGNKDVIDFLIKNDAKVNAARNDGTTALHEAALMGHVGAVDILIRNGAEVNANTNTDMTPLLAGVFLGHKDVVKLLIDDNVRAFTLVNNQKFPVNIKLDALKLAVYKGHTDIVKMLLENEDNINMSINKENINLLVLAVYEGHKEIVHVLLEKGADPNAIDVIKEIQNTPLSFASIKGYEEIVEILIAGGADVNLKLTDGGSPVEIAVEFDHLPVVKMLLKDKKSLHKEATGILSYPLLHIASRKGNLQMVEYLVDEGFDIYSTRNVYGAKPIHFAAKHGHKDIVDYFLRTKGLSINDTDATNMTLLHYAALNGHLEVIHYLIVHGADVNAKHDIGITPLHIAVHRGFKEVIKVLLKNGAIFNAADQFAKQLLEMTKDQEVINLLTSTVD